METQEKEKLTEKMESESISNLMAYRGHITILKNQFRTEAFKKDPVNTSIYENTTTAKMDINTTKQSVTGVNSIAKKAYKEGSKEAKNILDKYSQTSFSESINDAIDSANPFTSFRDYNKFQESLPLSVRQAEATARSEEEQERIDSRIGVTEAPINNKPFGYADNFKDKEAALNLLKSCIPCSFRTQKLGLEFGIAWSETLDDLKAKWKNLLKLIDDLLGFQAEEFSQDLCNLFKFLDGQCIPDILGLISLLSMIQLKLEDLSIGGLNNILNQLMAPFLSPIIGAFTSNLDQYAELIIGPLKCIVNALEFQIVNFQTQVNGVQQIAQKNRTAYAQKELDFVDNKAKLLRNRKRVLEKKLIEGDNEFSSNNHSIERRIVNTRLVEGGINLTATSTISLNAKGETEIEKNTWFLELEEEKDNIEIELEKLQEKKDDLKKNSEVKQNSFKPLDLSKATTLTAQSRFALTRAEDSYKSIMGDLVDSVNEGINIVKDSIDIYRDEFQRLILGRIDTQADQLEFTKQLQKIMRIVSIVRAVHDFSKVGLNLKKLCEMGEESTLSQVAKQLKTENSSSMFDFYQATDSEGNPLMVIAPGGAKLTVTGIEFDETGSDLLTGDSLINLESARTTVSFNDLNEVDKLNREGIVPNLGNIDAKLIELENRFSSGSELDLHFKSSYAIISSEFCSKSAISFGSSDTVKKWAETLWQEK